MNLATISCLFVLSFALVACGNKGDLYLETDQDIAEEIRQLDESLRQLEEERAADALDETAVEQTPEEKAAAEALADEVAKEIEAELEKQKARELLEQPLQSN